MKIKDGCGEDGNLSDMNFCSISDKIGLSSPAITTFQISEPRSKKKPSACCSLTALGVYLLLLTAGQGLLMYKVIKMQRDILKLQERNITYREEILQSSFASKLSMGPEENWWKGLEEEITIIKSTNANLMMKMNNITLVAGPPGRKGEPGPRGSTGEPGRPGQKGEAGEIGQRGPVGIPGPEGRPGQKGDKGNQGPSGSPGLPGTAGLRGEKGDRGETGPPGQKGTKGDKGPPGIPGPTGEKGSKGDYGSQGPKGEPGQKGAKGDRGSTGSTGEKGSKGEKGEASRNFNPYIQIVGGNRRGRVEIFHKGSWGTICDDGWGIQDANVVCRMLGYNSATSAFTATAGTGQIWLDDVNCSGNEHSIFDCPKLDWGVNNCSHSEDAGVECN